MKQAHEIYQTNEDVKALTDQLRCEIFNETEGSMNKVDGINCKVCRNKGYIYVIKNNEIVTKECGCVKQRKIMRMIIDSGLKEDFEKLTLASYLGKEKWQKMVKDIAADYIKNHQSKWFVISGQVGSGKTHICTAISGELIKQGYEFKYFAYAREMPRLQKRMKSGYMDVKEEAEREMERLMRCKVLYIDDFMKTKDIDNLFELIDYRYSQSDLITIISTEKNHNEMANIDEAIASRLVERSGKYWVSVGKETGRDQRLNHERKD